MESLGVEVNWDTIKAWCGKLGCVLTLSHTSFFFVLCVHAYVYARLLCRPPPSVPPTLFCLTNPIPPYIMATTTIPRKTTTITAPPGWTRRGRSWTGTCWTAR